MKFPCIWITACLVCGSAWADDPREFLQDALHGDNSEMMLGQLAQQRGNSSDVRKFGAALYRDHSQARAEVLSVGRRYGLRSDTRAAPEAKEEREKLTHMRGDEFDREFARYMVEDHRKDIDKFRDEASERHGSVSQLAAKQLPVLEKHLSMAQETDHDRDLQHGPAGRRR